MVIRFGLALLVTLIATVTFSSNVGEGVAIWDHHCFHITEMTRVTAPMKDGQPDMSRARMSGLEFEPNCYVYGVKK